MIDGRERIVVGGVWWFIWLYVWCREMGGVALEVGRVVLWIRWFQVCWELVGHLVFNGLVVIVQTVSRGRFLMAQRM